eukprot:gene24709-32186_t
MMRIPAEIYDYVSANKRHLVIPHRLMPYPEEILTYFWNRTLSTAGPYDWMDFTCCLPRQLCQERNHWIHVKNSSVPILNMFGLQVPLGNTDFHRETYRACIMDDYGTNRFQRECP